MPPNAEKRAELGVRREVVKHLILGVGLSKAKIARMFRVDRYSITNDCRQVGLQIPWRSDWSIEHNDTVYKNAFRTYVEIVFGQYQDQEMDAKVLDLFASTLGTYIDVKHIRSVCVGIADLMNCFNHPADDEMLGRYRNFLNNVFGVEYVAVLQGETLFMVYLEHILRNPTQVPSRGCTSKEIARWVFTSEMNNPRMPFGQEIIDLVEKALKLLRPQECMVIKARFGLSQSIQNLSEWAKEQDVSRAYASILYARGVEQFRSYFPEFGVFTSSIRYSVYTHWSQIANGVLGIHSMTPATNVYRAQLLSKSVETLPLPTRAHNCFKKANINTIGDLVQRTAKELMRLDNFGDRCLKETKQKLAAIGLSLGMKIPPTL
ncbi:MAG: DNA-directed polymerase subunit alpha [Patescibacteria group bacterium]|nr:DNA-directed polymerase subunit alpha [Patescibacteria group bacterium]